MGEEDLAAQVAAAADSCFFEYALQVTGQEPRSWPGWTRPTSMNSSGRSVASLAKSVLRKVGSVAPALDIVVGCSTFNN